MRDAKEAVRIKSWSWSYINTPKSAKCLSANQDISKLQPLRQKTFFIQEPIAQCTLPQSEESTKLILPGVNINESNHICDEIIAGRLKYFLHLWRELINIPEILETSLGVKLNFTEYALSNSETYPIGFLAAEKKQ